MVWATSVVNFTCILMLHDFLFTVFSRVLILYDFLNFFYELHKWYCRRMLSLCVNVLIINIISKHGGKNSVLHILIKIKRSNWIF